MVQAAAAHNTIEKTLKNTLLFRGCDQSFMQKLCEQGMVRRYQKGSLILFKDDHAERFYIITAGWVKLFRETIDGVQAVVDVLTTGDVFGEMPIFSDDGKHIHNAEAAEATETISLPSHLLAEEIKKNPSLSMNMMQFMAHKQKVQEQQIEHLAIQSAPQRIGCFLLRLITAEKRQGRNELSVSLPYDKTLIAAKLGMQPETFSRALKKLRESTDIDVDGSIIHIRDLNKLSGFSCAACSAEFPCKA